MSLTPGGYILISIDFPSSAHLHIRTLQSKLGMENMDVEEVGQLKCVIFFEF